MGERHNTEAPSLQLVESLREYVARESWDMNRAGQAVTNPTDGANLQSQQGPVKEVCRIRVPDNLCQHWTVTLAPLVVEGQQSPLVNGTGYAPQLVSDAFAVIEWGMMGSTSWAVVDWTVGQQLSIFGSFVRVWGGVVAFGTAVANPNPITRFSAHIVPGYTDRKPIRTIIYSASIAPAAESEFPVPAFARKVTLSGVIEDDDLEFTTLQGRMISGGAPIWNQRPGVKAIDGGTPDLDPNYMEKCYRLPIGTNFIAVGLDGGAGDPYLNARLRYELSLS